MPTWLPQMQRVVPPASLPPQPELPKIKVLHVITKFTTGAGGNTMLSAVGMDRDRYDVWVAAMPGGECWDRAEEAGVRMVPLVGFRETIHPPSDLLVMRQLDRLMRREHFSIVHTHTAKAGFVGRIAARRNKVPVVVHTFHAFPFHDFMSDTRRRTYRFLESAVSPLTHHFIAVSPRVAEQAVEHRLAPPGRISVIPSAVELDSIPDSDDGWGKRELGVPASAPLIGTVGRISFQKAPLDFVRMAALVARARPDARFVMVGDGPLMDDVRREARRLGVDIMLPGFRRDALRLAASFDVFVMASLYEGLGRALTEALASSRPVVAAAVNGVPDLVRPGATGLLVPPRDPEATVQCVLWLLDHPAEAAAMGRQGSRAVRSLFHPRLMTDMIDHTYRRLLGVEPIARAPQAPDRTPIVLPGVSEHAGDAKGYAQHDGH